MANVRETPIGQHLMSNVLQNFDRRAVLNNKWWTLFKEMEDLDEEMAALQAHENKMETDFARLDDDPQLLENEAVIADIYKRSDEARMRQTDLYQTQTRNSEAIRQKPLPNKFLTKAEFRVWCDAAIAEYLEKVQNDPVANGPTAHEPHVDQSPVPGASFKNAGSNRNDSESAIPSTVQDAGVDHTHMPSPATTTSSDMNKADESMGSN